MGHDRITDFLVAGFCLDGLNADILLHRIAQCLLLC
jgi:hypothetical protein